VTIGFALAVRSLPIAAHTHRPRSSAL